MTADPSSSPDEQPSAGPDIDAAQPPLSADAPVPSVVVHDVKPSEPVPSLVVRPARGWRVVQFVAVLSLLAYFIAIMIFRLNGALSEWGVDGDQHQSIGQFWRYSIKGAIPPGHLITDYAFAYHAPPLWWVIMSTLSTFSTPTAAAKIMTVVAYGLTALGALLVVGKRTDWLLGCFVAFLVLRSPDLPEQVTGGMARSLGPAFVYLFLYAFMQRRHNLVLLMLVLQAATYPSVVIPCGIFYGLYCVIAGPMPARLRRCGKLFVVGLLIILLGKAQDFRSPDWWGSVVTYEEADAMRGWHRGGRFEEVPHRPLSLLLDRNLERGHKKLGHTAAPAEAVTFVDRHLHTILLGIPLGLSLLALLIAGLRRRWLWVRAGERRPNPLDVRFPWEVVGLFACSIIGWGLVQLVSFKLFLPSRQLGFTIQYLVLVGLPLVAWSGAAALFRRRWAAVLSAVALTILPVFVFRGDGLARARPGYRDHQADAKIYNAVRKLPLDVEVACDVYYCELMMVLGQHAPYAAKNLTHPLRPGYYAEAERRFVAMQRVLYATTAAEVRAFVDNEHVKYFVYNTGSVGKLDGRLYHPAREQIVPAFNASKRKVRLLLKPPKEAVVFRDNERVLIDLDKLAIWAAAEETKKAALLLEGEPVKAEDAGAIDAPGGALDVEFDANIETRAERLRGLRRPLKPLPLPPR